MSNYIIDKSLIIYKINITHEYKNNYDYDYIIKIGKTTINNQDFEELILFINDKKNSPNIVIPVPYFFINKISKLSSQKLSRIELINILKDKIDMRYIDKDIHKQLIEKKLDELFLEEAEYRYKKYLINKLSEYWISIIVNPNTYFGKRHLLREFFKLI